MTDYNKLTVAELRDFLVSEEVLTKSEAAVTKKADLVKAVDGYIGPETEDDSLVDENLDDIDLDEAVLDDEVVETLEQDEHAVSYLSPDWSDHVKSQFTESELVEGKYPNVHGLRRVAELLLGPIIRSGPVELFPATSDGVGRASCIFVIEFIWLLDDYGNRIFKAAAGCSPYNAPDETFQVHPEAISETRAEARALRRALKLTVIAAEELSGVKPPVIEKESASWEPSGNISSSQISVIKAKCEQNNINVDKFINLGDITFSRIEDVTRGVAAKMVQLVNEYQRDESSIPESILVENDEAEQK